MSVPHFSRRLVTALGVAALLTTALPACSDTALTPPSGDATFSAALTATGGDTLSSTGDVLEHAVVTISTVYLQGAGGRDSLTTSPFTTDLVAYSGNLISLAQNVSVPLGVYSELRLIITGAYIQVQDGAGGTEVYASASNYEGLPPGTIVTGTLQLPNQTLAGIKVAFPGNALIIDSGSNAITISFNTAQSFIPQSGGIGGWVMNPILTSTTIDTVTTGGTSLPGF